MLVAAGVDFEDNRVQGDDWPKLKPSQYYVEILFGMNLIKNKIP